MSRPSEGGRAGALRLPRLAREAVADYGMFRGGGRLVVGVSGGADSVALLHFLVCGGPTPPTPRSSAPVHSGKLGQQRPREEQGPRLRVEAVHINHNLRGAESDRDERFVRDLCARWGVPLQVVSLPVAELAAERGLSIEECARNLRYREFARAAGGDGIIATAHTLDDSAETVLLNLARGTGLRGLCGIPPVRREGGVPVVRPLVRCTRADVEDYCAAHGLGYVTDSSNGDEHFARNRLRHRAIPALRGANPAFPRGMAGTLDALRADADYLDGLAAEALAPLRRGAHRTDAAGLLALPEPLRRRALLALLGEHGVPVSRDRVLELEALLRGGGTARISRGWFCRREGGELVFAPPEAPAEEVRERTLRREELAGEHRVFSDKTLGARVVPWEYFEENQKNSQNPFKNILDYDKIDEIVILRARLPGDRMRPAGRGCTKSLKKLCQEAGIPRHRRGRLLVLQGRDRLLWAEEFGPSQEVVATPGTERLLVLEPLQES